MNLHVMQNNTNSNNANTILCELNIIQCAVNLITQWDVPYTIRILYNNMNII